MTAQPIGDKFSRDVFLRLLGLGVLGTGCAIAAKKDSKTSIDLHVVERVGNVSSLEQCLALKTGKIEKWDDYSVGDVPKIEKPKAPAVLYVNVEVSEGFISSNQMGAVVLNSDGFFMTSADTSNKYSPFSCEQDCGRTVIVDPSSRIVADARLLAYSEAANIALGKFDPPQGYNIQPCPISDVSRPKPDSVVYSTSFRESKDTIKLIRDFWVIKGMDFFPALREIKPELFYGMTLARDGEFIPCAFYTEQELKQVRAGEKRPSDIPNNMFCNDDLGSPIFTLKNELFGILAQCTRQKYAPKDYTQASGPKYMHALLKGYIQICSEKDETILWTEEGQ